MSDDGLAYYGNRIARPERPVRRRWTAWALVGLIHVLFLILLQMSALPPDRAGKRTPVETILLLSMLPSANAPPVNVIKPEAPSASEPVIVTAPITLPPLTPPPNSSPAQTGHDVLRAVGDALACGASNYEYLSPARRALCRHQPWMGRKAADGTVVLDAPAKLLAPIQQHLSGADQQRRDMQTGAGSGCPVIVQGPCLKNLFTGQSEKPF